MKKKLIYVPLLNVRGKSKFQDVFQALEVHPKTLSQHLLQTYTCSSVFTYIGFLFKLCSKTYFIS